jgi:hypothetical protein
MASSARRGGALQPSIQHFTMCSIAGQERQSTFFPFIYGILCGSLQENALTDLVIG